MSLDLADIYHWKYFLLALTCGNSNPQQITQTLGLVLVALSLYIKSKFPLIGALYHCHVFLVKDLVKSPNTFYLKYHAQDLYHILGLLPLVKIYKEKGLLAMVILGNKPIVVSLSSIFLVKLSFPGLAIFCSNKPI